MYGWERNRRQPMPDAALFYAAVLFLLLLCGFAIGFAYQPMTSAPPIATVSLSANSTMDVEQEQPMTWQERLQDWWVEGWLQRFFVPEETETTEEETTEEETSAEETSQEASGQSEESLAEEGSDEETAAEELSDLLDKMTPEQLAALKEQIQKKEAEEKADEQ